MKRILSFLLLAFMATTLTLSAQSAADKIVGLYHVVKDGRNSKVKIFKYGDGYRAQVVWLENMKNPDPKKRNTPSNQIVLVEKVTFDGDDTWENGQIYDPTSGKVYRVEMYFDKPNVLTVKGKLGPFFKRVYWQKIQ